MQMRFGELDLAAGELKCGPLGYVELSDCTKVNIPTLIRRGAKDGPLCVMTAAVHGFEIIGAEVVHRLLRDEINSDELSGTLVAFPASNPLAFQSGHYESPQDSCNLSVQDFFDGNAGGSVTQRIACLIGSVLQKADYVLDIHGSGPEPSMCFAVSPDAYASSDQVRQETIKMTKATGLTLTRFKPEAGLPGFYGKEVAAVGVSRGAVAHGIPAITVELKDYGHLNKAVVDAGVVCIENVLKAVSMLRGDLEAIPGEPRVEGWFNLWGFARPTHGGLLHILKQPGERLQKGDVIAKVFNIYGDEIEEILMPVDGFCSTFQGGWHGRYDAIATGDIAAIIWEKCDAPI